MSDQDNGKVSTLQRPTTDDKDTWKTYWTAKGWPWRTEPEIDTERQKYLDERRKITPDIEEGIYPFRDIKLSRADVEWLLATHENGRGPVDWSDENQRKREGLDLRGTDLRMIDLSRLPLARMRGGLHSEELNYNENRRLNMAGIHLEEANFFKTNLEGAILGGAFLQQARLEKACLEEAELCKVNLQLSFFYGSVLNRANLRSAHLEGARFQYGSLEGTILSEANLEGAYFKRVSLKNANLVQAYAKDVSFISVNFFEADLSRADMQEARFGWAVLNKADLSFAHFEGASLRLAQLEGANLSGAFFDGNTQLNDIKTLDFVYLADLHWGDVNLAVIDWDFLKTLVVEIVARKGKTHLSKLPRSEDYKRAVRANRQLAVALHAQGLNETATRFAYRAQKLQRTVLWQQKKFGQYFFSLLLDLLAGYGYRPGCSVIWYLATILVFALAYHFLGGLTLYPPDAFVFSVMSFHGRGFFPALSQETNLHNPLVMLAALEAIIGLLIEISFIATFTQRFFGG